VARERVAIGDRNFERAVDELGWRNEGVGVAGYVRSVMSKREKKSKKHGKAMTHGVLLRCISLERESATLQVV